MISNYDIDEIYSTNFKNVMSTQASKTKESNSQHISNNVLKKKNESKLGGAFVDNRPEAVQLRALQEMANNSSNAEHKKLQEMANNSSHTSQLKELQEMANHSSKNSEVAQLQALADKKAAEGQSFNGVEAQKHVTKNNTGLPDNLKSGIENLSGFAMDDVKVYRNSNEPAKLQAHAYAQGSDIHLASGQEKHLPHEAWHVVQQKQGRVQPTTQMKGKVNINNDTSLEKEADLMGERALKVSNVNNENLQKHNSLKLEPSRSIQRKEDLTSEELNAENEQFFASVKEYINEQITLFETKITNLEASYKKKNWAIDKSTGKFKPYTDRVSKLKSYKSDIELIETAVRANGGDDLLTLMNVIQNEAGAYSSEAKKAIAYAYLNRIGYSDGGSIREPINGSEISHYSKLNDRWGDFPNSAEKLEFLGSIKGSFDAANSRYSNEETDPTDGATHWVSPAGLSDKPRSGYYERTYDGITTQFPNWARSNKWVEENPDKAKDWFDVENYKELEATDVDGKDFLFYKGVY